MLSTKHPSCLSLRKTSKQISLPVSIITCDERRAIFAGAVSHVVPPREIRYGRTSVPRPGPPWQKLRQCRDRKDTRRFVLRHLRFRSRRRNHTGWRMGFGTCRSHSGSALPKPLPDCSHLAQRISPHRPVVIDHRDLPRLSAATGRRQTAQQAQLRHILEPDV